MYQRILAAIDGSPTAMRGLDEAIRLAKLAGAQLRILHVLDELIFVTGFETGATYLNDVLPRLKEGGESILADGKARADSAGVAADTQLVECFGQRTSETIIAEAEAWKADLIVLGTHGRRGIGRFLLGSDADRCCGTPACRCCSCAQSPPRRSSRQGGPRRRAERVLVPARRVELPTFALRMRCSTN